MHTNECLLWSHCMHIQNFILFRSSKQKTTQQFFFYGVQVIYLVTEKLHGLPSPCRQMKESVLWSQTYLTSSISITETNWFRIFLTKVFVNSLHPSYLNRLQKYERLVFGISWEYCRAQIHFSQVREYETWYRMEVQIYWMEMRRVWLRSVVAASTWIQAKGSWLCVPVQNHMQNLFHAEGAWEFANTLWGSDHLNSLL